MTTREEILALARKFEWYFHEALADDEIVAFFHAAQALEREDCAKAWDGSYGAFWSDEIAAAIRARSKK